LAHVGLILKCPSAKSNSTSEDPHEDEDKLCKEIYYQFSHVQFQIDPAPFEDISEPHATDLIDASYLMNQHTKPIEQFDNSTVVQISSSFKIFFEGFQYSICLTFVFTTFTLLSDAKYLPMDMVETFQSIVSMVDCNPRNIKTLMNLLQIVSEIAKHKPITGFPLRKISQDENNWKIFSKKLVVWFFMAHNFTYRLSALVQVLLDFEQKKAFNISAATKEFKYKTCQVNIHHGNTVEARPDAEDIVDIDKMTILQFYQKYVEKYIHIFRNAERLSRVDKDPEEFALLLSKCDSLELKCKDILGPYIDGVRRKDFSLLSYSFNLDPAMRREVSNIS